MKSNMALLPWLIWVVGYYLYMKVRHKNVWESKIYAPVTWILCIIGNIVALYLTSA